MCHDALEGLRRPAGLYVRGDTLHGIEEVARRFGASAGYFKVVSDDEILAEIDDAVLSEKEK